jgi:hypothetical protein
LISSNSNNNNASYCQSNQPSYKLPPAIGEGCEKGSSSINGGKVYFKSKNIEVYRVFVSNLYLLNIFRKNMKEDRKRREADN